MVNDDDLDGRASDCGIIVTQRIMSDVTQILEAIESGDPHAASELLPLVYDELRRLAQSRMRSESPDHTLDATSLVHEAYLRLIGGEDPGWQNRGHFFAAAAEAMRRILIDSARSRESLKRGGNHPRVALTDSKLVASLPDADLLALSEALEQLERTDPQLVELVKLRYFAGLSFDEAAPLLGISVSTAKRHWAYAKAWLFRAIQGK